MTQTKSDQTWKNLLVGGVSGAVEATIMYPTEYVKTQVQLAQRAAKSGGVGPRYTGIWDCAVKTVQERGPLGLYRGLSTLVIGSIPKAAVRFAAYQQLAQSLRDDSGKMSPQASIVAGLGAGCAEAIIAVTPVETIKTQLISDQNSKTPKYNGLVHGVRTMIAEEGIRGIYKGLLATILKQSMNQGARFTVYDAVIRLLKGSDPNKPMGVLETAVAGAVAGAFSVYITMPFDVVKTRMQQAKSGQYAGTFQCLAQTVREDGFMTLWKGTTPRLGRVMCSSTIIFTSYEYLMKALLKVYPDPPKAAKKIVS